MGAVVAALEQLVYFSRASFPSRSAHGGIEPQVARILVQSRLNNPKRGLVGALYFGDGHFFQVLEGAGAELDALLERLARDPRHEDFQVLIRRPLAQRGFRQWSMKYVALAEDVQALLRRHGLRSFEPARFSPAVVEELVALLQQGKAFSAQQQVDPVYELARQEYGEQLRRRTWLWAALGGAGGLIFGLLLAAVAWAYR